MKVEPFNKKKKKKQNNTHSLVRFLQLPIKSGILPDNELPSILLQEEYKIFKILIKYFSQKKPQMTYKSSKLVKLL